MKRKQILLLLILILAVVLAALVTASILLRPQSPAPTEPTTSSSDTTLPFETEGPTQGSTEAPTDPPIVKESTFTVSAIGDMLMHNPIYLHSYDSTTDSYNFDAIFRYFSDYITADLAVANLETTLAGLDNGYAYSGYPQFNCPDSIIDSLKSAGFDMILTANNHTYDTGTTGLHRTLEILAQRELLSLGTRSDPELPDYVIAEQNGIKIGMLCYTYETTDGSGDKIALNGIPLTAADSQLVNAFSYGDLPGFYEDVQENLTEMAALGAEATILFIHWGNEYQIEENSTQRAIAQALCDLGIDVIIGGHPHVVQPVELLTSTTDETQKTVCLYSMGNAVSNQRRERMRLQTGHTEDGVLFSVSFSKYSDGTVILSEVSLLPTWVDMRLNSSYRREYIILPLDTAIEDWKTQFSLTDDTLAHATASYDRTMAIVGEGMDTVTAWLAEHVAQTEETLGVTP